MHSHLHQQFVKHLKKIEIQNKTEKNTSKIMKKRRTNCVISTEKKNYENKIG